MSFKAQFEKQKSLSSKDILFGIAGSANSSQVYVGSSDAGVYALNLDDEKPQRSKFGGEGHTSYVTDVVLAGPNLVTCGYDQKLCWWSVEEKRLIRSFEAHDRWIRRIAVSPDGKLVASVADDMQCKIWSADSGELTQTLTGHQETTPHHYPSMLYAVAWSQDGDSLVTADRVGKVHVWDVNTGDIVAKLEAPTMYTWDPRARRHSIGGIRSVAFSTDGKQLAVGGIGKIGNIDHLGGPARIEIFDLASSKRIHEIESPKFKGLVEGIQYGESGKWLMACGGDHKGFLMILDAQTGESITEQAFDTHIHDMWLDEKNRRVVTSGHQRIAAWNFSA